MFMQIKGTLVVAVSSTGQEVLLLIGRLDAVNS